MSQVFLVGFMDRTYLFQFGSLHKFRLLWCNVMTYIHVYMYKTCTQLALIHNNIPPFRGPSGLLLREDFDLLGTNLSDDFLNPPWAIWKMYKLCTKVRFN